MFNNIALRLNAALAGFGLAYLPEDQVQAQVAEGRLARHSKATTSITQPTAICPGLCRELSAELPQRVGSGHSEAAGRTPVRQEWTFRRRWVHQDGPVVVETPAAVGAGLLGSMVNA